MRDRLCSRLSKGYRQRVGLAQALIHNPDVLILDEPTAGLDPKQIIETRQLITELGGDHTIILSTHILPEVSQTCQRVVIINKGRVVAVDTPDNLTARLRGSETMYVQLDARGADVGPALGGVPGVTRVVEADRRDGVVGYEIDSASGHDVRRELARAVVTSGWGLLELRPMRMSLEDVFLSLTTEEAPTARLQERPRMSNIVAIAQKELKSYFASPIAYIVIGVFALLYGFFYFIMLQYFMRVSLQAMAGGGQSVNINEMMLRPMLQNVTVIVLFVLPMVTMRTYSEEKRSGTIELLLTSPLTDFQIIMGKFLGALALYAAMLAITLIHIAILFIYGSPEWKPLVTAYLGLLLLGSCFICDGAVRVESDQESGCRGRGDVWIGAVSVGHQLAQQLLDRHDRDARHLSVAHRSLRRLLEGRHRHDAPRLLPELHYIRAFSDRQVGRQRTVARLMATRIFNIIGWLGTAFVFAAVAIRIGLPSSEPLRVLPGVGGAGVHGRLHDQPVARDRAHVLPTADAPGHSGGLGRADRARHPRRDQLHREAAEQAVGPDGRQAVHAVGSEPEHPGQAGCTARDPGVRPRDRVSAIPRSTAGVRERLETG